MLMSEFIEPFLVALSQFLTEEERGKLPPPWSEREEEEKKKGKRKRQAQGVTDEGYTGNCIPLIPAITILSIRPTERLSSVYPTERK